MAFNQKVPFLANIKHGLIENDKTLEDMVKDIDSTLTSIKTRLYQINQTKTVVSPLDKFIAQYLANNCKGFKQWAKAHKIDIK